jgi:hypothetical protein
MMLLHMDTPALCAQDWGCEWAIEAGALTVEHQFSGWQRCRSQTLPRTHC